MKNLTKTELEFYSNLIESTMKRYTLTVSQAIQHLKKQLHSPIVRQRIYSASISMKNKENNPPKEPGKIWEYHVFNKTLTEITESIDLKDDCVYIRAENETKAREKIQKKMSEFLMSLREQREN